MIHNNPMAYSEPPLPVGTSYTITSSRTWTCPATGQWQIELHGGGGGGSGPEPQVSNPGAGGGGSGDMQTFHIAKEAQLSITIGQGGNGGRSNWDGSTGGTSSITGAIQYSCQGGNGGEAGYPFGTGGTGQGNLATDGSAGSVWGGGGAGGEGNRSNRNQVYGDGGAGSEGGYADGSAGQPGAAILTYLGK